MSIVIYLILIICFKKKIQNFVFIEMFETIIEFL